MANLTNINRCSQETFDAIVNGTHATETYDDNAMYQVELDEPIQIGTSLNVANNILNVANLNEIFKVRSASDLSVTSVLDITDNGYYLLSGSSFTDLPSTVYFHLLVFGNERNRVLLATRLTYSHYVIYMRKKNDTNWSDWKSVTLS